MPNKSTVDQIDDYSASIRQARIGINENYKDLIHDNEHDDKCRLMRFVKEKFNSIECRYFCKKENGQDENHSRCMCGEIKKYHKSDKSVRNPLLEWTEANVMESKPTDTFGKIEFIGEDINNTKLTDFVRISYKDQIDDTLDLMFNYWNIDIGTLCISVIGGNENFKMRKKETDIFCQGLIKTAKTTNALIITNGLNQGITRIVGDAIQDGQLYFYDKTKHNNFICCLGITSWGYVKNRKTLESANGQNVKYKVTNEIKPDKPISLNKNHTHYVFVDEGLRFNMEDRATEMFRGDIVKKLCQKTIFRDAIPVVMLIVEGSHDTFREASRSIKENIPIVICEGSGLVADILGEVFREIQRAIERRVRIDNLPLLTKDYRYSLKQKLIDDNISTKDNVDEAIEYIENIMEKEYLVTIFDLKVQEDLDIAILYSLIKRMDYISDSKQNSISRQLSLCLIWNRVDIVKDKIFSGDISLSDDEWTSFLKESIINGKVEFIELFLQNVANIEDFLTTDNLRELYEQCPKSKNFHKTFLRLMGRTFRKGLIDIRELLTKIVGNYESPCFSTEENMKHPFQELFLWAILMEKHECAKFFWEKCDESLLLALIATRIYKCHTATSVMDTDRNKTLMEWKDYFETLAVKIVEECYDIDQETAAYLIEKENPTWGGITCLHLAYKAKDLNFIASMVCQNSIEFKWRGGFNINFLQCILCVIFPFLIVWRTDYDIDPYIQDLETSQNEIKETKYKSSSNGLSKLKPFYRSPQTKFCIHCFAFVSFVIYFSYVVLYGMKRMMLTTHEMIFMIYLILMMIEKFMEILQSKSKGFLTRVKKWWKFNYWNKFDVFIMILSIAAMFLRLRLVIIIKNYDPVMIFRCSKTLYSLIVGMLHLKIFRLLAFHKNLGPKLIMMMKLVKELMVYLIIIAIFLISYGVTSQAAYYPQRDFSWSNLSNVLDYPYWTLFGVLNLPNSVYFSWCDSITTNFNISNNCPENNFVIPIVFAAYVIISNILLLNVLIASFSFICHGIQRNAIDVWKFSFYSLVIAYDVKTILPLPFSFLVYLFDIWYFCYFKSGLYNLINRNKLEITNIEAGKGLNKLHLSKSATLLISSDMYIESELDKLVKYFENNSQKSVIKVIVEKKHKLIDSGIFRMENRSKLIDKDLEKLQIHLNKKLLTHSKGWVQTKDNLDLSQKDKTSENKTKYTPIKIDKILELSTNTKILLKELKESETSKFHSNTISIENVIVTNDQQNFQINRSQDKDEKYEIEYGESIKSTNNNPITIRYKYDNNDAIINEYQIKNNENWQEIKNIDKKLDLFKLQFSDSMMKIESIVKSLQK